MGVKIHKLLIVVICCIHGAYSSSSSSLPPSGMVPPSSSLIPTETSNAPAPSNNGAPPSSTGTPPSNTGAPPSNNNSPAPSAPTTGSSNNGQPPINNTPSVPSSTNNGLSPTPSSNNANNGQVPPNIVPSSNNQGNNNAPPSSNGPAPTSNAPSPSSNNQGNNTPPSNSGPSSPNNTPTPSSNSQAGNNVPSTSSQNSQLIAKENIADLDLISTISEFQVDLYSIIIPNVKSIVNVAISGFSVQMALALLYCGSGGVTQAEMQASLIFNNLTTTSIVAEDFYYFLRGIKTTNHYAGAMLEIANAIYIKEGYAIRKSYKALAQKRFLSEVRNIDFHDNVVAAETINTYISNHTNGKITDLVQANTITKDTVMILVNTIYFKAFWSKQFYQQKTVNGSTFYTSSSTTTTVDMMYQEGMFNYWYMEDFKTKVIQLTYQGSEMSMLIFLPDSYDGMSKLESDYETFNYTDIINEMTEYKVKLYLPKFTIEYEISLKNELTKLGMGIMFDKENANFSAILKEETYSGGSTQIPQIYVSEVRHKVHIEVNEKGTIAAAATEVAIARFYARRISKNTQYAEFKADHSFLFILINRGQDVMFTGRYVGGK